MNTTKSHALLEALQKGEQLTAKQITSRFGIANPTASGKVPTIERGASSLHRGPTNPREADRRASRGTRRPARPPGRGQ